MNTSARLQVAVEPPSALLKISGRANHASSVDFKTVMYELRARGYRDFTLDLTDCQLMDSTFIGILAGFCLKIQHAAAPPHQPVLRLLNPSERICDLLENLGIAYLFEIHHTPAPHLTLVNVSPVQADKRRIAQTSLEAHLTLMALNHHNEAKFKDVARFLAEDLEKLEHYTDGDGNR